MLTLLFITLPAEIIFLGILDGLDWLIINLPILFVAFAIVFFFFVLCVPPSLFQLSSTHSEQVLVSLSPLSINHVDMNLRESHEALMPQESGVSVHLVCEDAKDNTRGWAVDIMW